MLTNLATLNVILPHPLLLLENFDVNVGIYMAVHVFFEPNCSSCFGNFLFLNFFIFCYH